MGSHGGLMACGEARHMKSEGKGKHLHNCGGAGGRVGGIQTPKRRKGPVRGRAPFEGGGGLGELRAVGRGGGVRGGAQLSKALIQGLH